MRNENKILRRIYSSSPLERAGKGFKHTVSFLLLLFFCSMNSFIYAQTKVSANIDTASIKIGEQLHLTFEAIVPKGNKISFPVLKDTITEKIEIIGTAKMDTTVSGDVLKLTKKYTITSFDSGYWAIPPFSFYLNNDSTKSFETEALLLTVNTVAVDTSKAIKPIKQPFDTPITFREMIPYILGGLLLVALIVAVVYVIIKKRKQKPVAVVTVAPVIPAHEKALKRLKEIEDKKLWQNDMIKEYYSGISDTLREYIEDRFKIKALEQTTDQTKRSFRHVTTIDQNIKGKLFTVLELADMVKFAKEVPVQQEHEMSMNNAVEFVKESMGEQGAGV